MSSEMVMSCVKCSFWALSLVALAAGCVATTKSPMAEQVHVCGKLYKPQTTVVVVREEPQWVSGYEEDCSGSSLISPQPKTHDGGKAELSKALNIATLHLRGMPQFFPAGAKPGSGATGVSQGAGVAPAFPVVPTLSMTTPVSSRPVPTGSLQDVKTICAAGQSLLQTDVYFPRGVQDVSGPEREKLRQLRGRPISYVLIEGLTEVPGLTSSMVPLARARAQSVQQALQDALAPGVSVQQGVRAGCCTKKGEAGSAGHDDLGVSVTACMGTLTPVKKGDGSSMAK